MRIDHKRPLLAFFVVLTVCAFIVLNGLRGQAAVMAALHAGTGRVVKGVELVAIRATQQEGAARELMEPPVLGAAASAATAAPAAGQLPAITDGGPERAGAAPAETGPATSGQRPGQPARTHGHHHGAPHRTQHAHDGVVGPDDDGSDHPGRSHHGRGNHDLRGHEARLGQPHAVRHLTGRLTHGVERLLDRHAGPADDRGHQRRHGYEYRGRGHDERGRGHDNHDHDRDHDHRGRGHGHAHQDRGFSHDRGRHLGWERRH